MSRVMGVDAYRGGWIGITIADGAFGGANVAGSLDALIDGSDVQAVGVDIPIGLPTEGSRQADLEARKRLGLRRSSVFAAPPRVVLEAPTYRDACEVSLGLAGKAISRQSYALAPKILEAEIVAASGAAALFEVHPEVSFGELAGHPLLFPKKSWNGAILRRDLLREAGIELPSDLGDAGLVPIDDVLDAAAGAWSASRIAAGVASSLPDPPEIDAFGRPMAIWY